MYLTVTLATIPLTLRVITRRTYIITHIALIRELKNPKLWQNIKPKKQVLNFRV
jgi:hypothetical protein